MWNYHSTLQCNVANYIVNCGYFGNKSTNPGTCARGLALEMISLASNDLKVSTKTKAAQMGNLGFGVGLEILLIMLLMRQPPMATQAFARPRGRSYAIVLTTREAITANPIID